MTQGPAAQGWAQPPPRHVAHVPDPTVSLLLHTRRCTFRLFTATAASGHAGQAGSGMVAALPAEQAPAVGRSSSYTPSGPDLAAIALGGVVLVLAVVALNLKRCMPHYCCLALSPRSWGAEGAQLAPLLPLEGGGAPAVQQAVWHRPGSQLSCAKR